MCLVDTFSSDIVIPKKIKAKNNTLQNLFELIIDDKLLVIELNPNKNLFSKYTLIEYAKSGNDAQTNVTYEKRNLNDLHFKSCFYHGKIVNIKQPNSVALSTCDGLVCIKLFYFYDIQINKFLFSHFNSKVLLISITKHILLSQLLVK